ncbi:DUF6452 family protein [Tenacibaculum sp. IB213877]|uniref:DUF6452 family protein n=1 Tax=Tenacibaculum sp. IB213877 TaxID=3097351 RepID=UPI002A59FB96|nr:DUF6452 family protein [Tenacibaculum sp. IB213877]MDY0779296.1 DUF6452 family protein [Tenacibaculum sp. IB213877]
MKRIAITFLILTVIIISSCEKDDFCTQNPVTPSLVLRFYSKDTVADTKKADSLYVWVDGKDSIYKNLNTDSIALPLNTLAQQTKFNLSKGTLQTATLTINYTTEDEYVSRSCGYRVLFNDVSFEKTGWIDSLSVTEIPTINNQSSAHVKIYH